MAKAMTHDDAVAQVNQAIADCDRLHAPDPIAERQRQRQKAAESAASNRSARSRIERARSRVRRKVDNFI
jgi:hypothetical protein